MTPTPEVMDWIEDLVPREDRDLTAPIFTQAETSLRRAITLACKHGGIPHYYPHHLRHRFISLRMQAGWPVETVATAVGHSKTSMTHDTYSHVLTEEPWEILRDARGEQERWLRGASVVPRPIATTSENDERPANADPSTDDGGYRDRTGDLLLAKQALSHLS